MLYSLSKIVLEHPYLPITATSPQRPLSFVPKVADVERFVRLYRQFRFLGTRGFLPACEKTKTARKKASAFAGYVHRSSRAFIFLSPQPPYKHDTKRTLCILRENERPSRVKNKVAPTSISSRFLCPRPPLLLSTPKKKPPCYAGYCSAEY